MNALGLAASLRTYASRPYTAAEKERMLCLARARGVDVSAEEVQSAADEFRTVCGLERANDTRAWFRWHRIALEHFRDYLQGVLVRDGIERLTDPESRTPTPRPPR